MFSCYRSARLTIDRLERPLVLTERINRFGHLLICRHCRNHDRQIRGLAMLFQLKQEAVEPAATSSGTSANSNESGLSDAARSRIATVLSERCKSS